MLLVSFSLLSVDAMVETLVMVMVDAMDAMVMVISDTLDSVASNQSLRHHSDSLALFVEFVEFEEFECLSETPHTASCKQGKRLSLPTDWRL